MSYGQNPDPQNPYKLVKNLVTPPTNWLTTQQASRFFAKLLYEFWGFCVNGTNDLRKPGGFANIAFPANFESGSLVLLASGNTGYTSFATDEFRCQDINFAAVDTTSSLRNSYLVTWKEGSTSTDDSIYRILKVASSSSIKVDVCNGGTTRFGGTVSFSNRENVNFRIVDFSYTAETLPGWGDHNLVFNLSGSSNVNTNQAISQFRLAWTQSQSNIMLNVSPSGSWDGTKFLDSPTPVSQSWFSGGTEGPGRFYMAAGKDFLLCHVRGDNGAWNSSIRSPVMHIEVPKRLYSESEDRNPVAWMMTINGATTSSISPSTGTYSDRFNMVCHDGITRPWNTLVKTLTSTGDQIHFGIVSSGNGVLDGISKSNINYGNVHRNELSSSFIVVSDAVLSQTGSISNNQYSLARARLRRVKFTAKNLAMQTRVGENWLHVGGGILWPWDGSKLMFDLFPEGGAGEPGGDEG
jgi:hypothetical protein